MINVYDRIYGQSKEYHGHYKSSVYFPIWLRAIKWVKEPVLDIGCGPGQFAEMLFDHDIRTYTGWDISQVAINMAQSKKLGYAFRCTDVFDEDIEPSYKTVVLLELLEHLEDDIELVRRIPPGMRVVFSVPNFDSETHVRIFLSENAIHKRYGTLLDIKESYIHKFSDNSKIYLYDAYRCTTNME